MEDILAVILIFGGAAIVGIAYSPIGRALADRLRHGVQQIAPENDAAIWEEFDRLRAELAEVQERLDFSERLLGQARPVAAEEE